MNTGYEFDITEEEILFTKDKEEITEAKDELMVTVAEPLNYNFDDAEFYANWLVNQCLKEFA